MQSASINKDGGIFGKVVDEVVLFHPFPKT